MTSIDPHLPPQEELPADPTTQNELRSSLLLLALIGLTAPCILCWYSTRTESLEQVLIPGLMAGWVLVYTFYSQRQREQKQDLAPPLWRAGIDLGLQITATALALIWLVGSIGWHPISGPAILILGSWTFFLAGRRVWESWSFSRLAVREETALAKLEMISLDGGHPIHPQLVYRYAEKYRGECTNNRIRNKTPEIRQAIEQDKLRVSVKYLPENPRVHRFLGWKILP
jgi:hypothetical protein